MKKIGEYYVDYLNHTLDINEYSDEEKQEVLKYLSEPEVAEVFNRSGIPDEVLFDDRAMLEKYKITLPHICQLINNLLFEQDIYAYNRDGELEAHHHNILDKRHNDRYTFKIKIQLTENQPVFLYSIHDETTGSTGYHGFPLSELGKTWVFRTKDAIDLLHKPEV